jgi:integrase
MSKNKIFSQYVNSYTTGKNQNQKWAASVPDGRGGQLRKQGFATKEHACLWAKGAYERIQMGVYHTDLTFVEFCYECLVKERSVRPKTRERYEGIVRNYLSPFFENRKMEEIDLYTVHRFRSSLETNQRISATYRRTIFHTFKQAFKEAAERGLVTDTRVIVVKPPKQNPSPAKVWSEEEIKKFLSHTKVQSNSLYLVWKFAVFSGLRAGELAGLRWIDIEDGKVHVRRVKCQTTGEIFEGTKNKDTRIIPLLPEAKEALQELKQLTGTPISKNLEVFNGISMKHLSRDLKTACRASGVTEIRMHDLRHTFATRLTGRGANPRLISMLLGHRDSRSTERYVHKNADLVDSLWEIFVSSKTNQQNSNNIAVSDSDSVVI